MRIEREGFAVTVEVVPPAGFEVQPTLSALERIAHLPFDGYSVATNPVAKARMSALALGVLLQRRIGKPAILHCTTRDHNRLSLQGLLWGARALGVETILAATGDFVALSERAHTTTVRDVDVFSLIQMAREAGHTTGAVLDPRFKKRGLRGAVHRAGKKVAAGAQFLVTQPLFDEQSARVVADAARHLDVPIVMGILPLRTARHAEFLHERVDGIMVPSSIRERMRLAAVPVAEGIAGAREMLEIAREMFAGACIMPPFDHYEIMEGVLAL